MPKSVSKLTLITRGLLHPFFPALIFLVFLGMALGLQYGIRNQDRDSLQQYLDGQAQLMAQRLEQNFMVHLQAVQRMARRLDTDSSITRDIWSADASNHLEDFGVYQAIEWIDSDYRIQWLEPFEGNKNVIG